MRKPLNGGMVPFVANSTQVLELPQDGVYDRLIFRLSGQLTDATNSDILLGDEWALVREIRVLAGGNIIRRMSGYQLNLLAEYFHGHPHLYEGIIGSGDANPAFDTVCPLWFTVPDIDRPWKTRLDSRRLGTKLLLEIDWGTYDSISSDATGWEVEPQLYVEGVYDSGVLNADGSPFDYLNNRIESAGPYTLSGTANQRIELPRLQTYRGILLDVRDDSGDPTDDLTGDIVVRNTSQELFRMDAAMVQEETRKRSIMTMFWDNNATFMEMCPFYSLDTHDRGLYFVNFLSDDRRGLVSESLPTVERLPNGAARNFSDFWMELTNATADATLRMLPMTFENPPAN